MKTNDLWWSRELVRISRITDLHLRDLDPESLEELQECAERIANNIVVEKHLRKTL